MDDVEERILSYPHLSAEEQREIHEHVQSNPEWASLLRDVRALEDAAVFPQEDAQPAALIATYVVVQDLHPETIPPALARAFERLEGRIDEDEGLQQEIEAARERLAEAQASFDASAQFEELTGYSVQEASIHGETLATATTDSGRVPLIGLFRDLPLLVRGAVAATLVAAAVYGGLFAVSTATQSTLDRLAVIEPDQSVIENYVTTRTRSIAPDATASADSLYLNALTALHSAQSSTLGLFPHFERSPLQRSEELFRQVLAKVDSSSFLALETRFYLGKIALAKGDREAARTEFRAVVEGEGRKMAEAQRILRRLDNGYPDGGN